MTRKNRSGTPWTEEQRREKGWRQLKVRVGEDATKKLEDLAEWTGKTRGEIIEALIDVEWRAVIADS